MVPIPEIEEQVQSDVEMSNVEVISKTVSKLCYLTLIFGFKLLD